MNCSFDGLRKKLVKDFNAMTQTKLDMNQKTIMDNMRDSIVGLIGMYDPDQMGEDCNDLSDKLVVNFLYDNQE